MTKYNLYKQSFIQGTIILFAAGIVNRVLGFIPRMMLPRIIGAEGVGIYQLAYPFLIVMITLITGGIPLAIAKLIAEAEVAYAQKHIKRILSVALQVTISAAILFSIVILFLAPWITSHVLTDVRVYPTFLIMTPALIIVAVSSVLRGYFQGMQNMIPTASSQITETVIRIITVILFAYIALPYGLAWAAAGAMIGVIMGELAGFVVLAWMYVTLRKKNVSSHQFRVEREHPPTYTFPSQPTKQTNILYRLLQISLPVTGGKLIGALSYLLESITITHSLAMAGVLTATATAQYGALQGMIIPIIILPGALTYSLSVSLVPILSEALGRHDMIVIQKRIHQALRLVLVSGAPFAVIMFVLSLPLCTLLYANSHIAPMLSWMAPVALFIYLQAPLQAALQALDHPGIALTNTLIGALLKMILIIILASNPTLGITGAIIAINVNVVAVTLLHAYSIRRHIHVKLPWTDFLKVTVAMFITAACMQATHHYLSTAVSHHVLLHFLLSSCSGLLIYSILLIILRLIDRNDIIRIPLFGRLFT